MTSPVDPDCLFCRVANGQVPATVVAETEKVLAFRDIAPVAPTHILVIPKVHISDVSALRAEDATLLGELVAVARQLAIDEGVGTSGYRLVMNVGDDGGMTVAHLHVHLIGGRALSWPPG